MTSASAASSSRSRMRAAIEMPTPHVPTVAITEKAVAFSGVGTARRQNHTNPAMISAGIPTNHRNADAPRRKPNHVSWWLTVGVRSKVVSSLTGGSPHG